MPGTSYRALLRTPSVPWLLTSSLVARLPIAMTGLAVVLAVTRAGGSYGRAGAVTAVVVFAQGVTQPVFGRAADRLGRRPVLRVLAVANAGAAVLLAFAVAGSLPLLYLAAALTGATSPPVMATMRAVWSGIVSGSARQSAYALEATAQEVMFIAGPLLTALLAALVSARAAVAASGIIGLVGTWGMTATPAVDAREESGTQRHRGSAVRVAALRRCMLTLGLMVLALNCIELGVIAAVSHGKAASTFAGVVIALWSVGSIAGGLWYGAHRGRQRPAAAHVFPVAAAFAVLIAAPNVPVLVILLVAGGTTVAPMFGRMYAEVSAVSPPSVITEAYSWIGVGNLTGAAIGSPLGGYLISATSPRIAFVAGTAAVTLAGLAAIGLRPLPIPELSAHVEPAVRTGP